MPAQFNESADGRPRKLGWGALALAVGLPLVVVLLVFAGMVSQFDQAMWNLYGEVYRDLPARVSERARADVFQQLKPASSEAEHARGRLQQTAEDMLLPGQQLDSVEIYFRRGGEMLRWHDLKRGMLESIRSAGDAADGASRDAVELTGSLRTAKLISKMPRLFWIDEMQLLVPIAGAEVSGAEENEGPQALMLLRITPRDMRIFMGQLAGLGLLLYLLLGATMALLTRNALDRASAVALDAQRRRDLGLLHRITQMLARAASEDFDFAEFLRELKSGLGAESAGICARARGQSRLDLLQWTGDASPEHAAAAGEALTPAALDYLQRQTRPLYVDNASAAADLAKAPLFLHGPVHFAWAPLLAGHELFGGLCVATRGSRPFGEQERHILEVSAMNLMLIFMSDTMRAESQKRQERFQSLGRLADAISANAELEEIMGMILQEALRGTESVKGFIAIRGEQENQFLVFRAVGFGEAAEEMLTDPHQNKLVQTLIAEGRALHGAQAMELNLRGDVLRREALRGMLAVPIVSHREHAVGALALFNRQHADFGESEREIAAALANQAAIAHDQSRILEAHREQSRRYEAILEQARDLIFCLDQQGRFTYINRAFAELLGGAESSLLGQELVKFCHTGDLAWFRRDLENLFGGARIVSASVRLRDLENRWRFIDANLSPIEDRARASRGVFGIARDVTEARLTDMRQKRLLGVREVVADLRIGLPLHDILGAAVSSIGRLFGVDWAAILLGESEVSEGQGWQLPDDVHEPGNLLGPPMRGYLFRRAMAGRFFLSGDLMSEFFAQASPRDAAESRRRPVPISCEGAAIVSSTGEQHGVILLFHESPDFFHGWDEMPLRNLGSELGNLISQKFLESQILIQNQELAERTRRATEATHLKSRFLAAISHELRTPLHAIIGFTEVVMDKTPELPPRRMRNLDAVLRNARMLLNLIEDLLDLSRIEAGKVKIRSETFGVGDLLEEVAQTMRSLVEIKGLTLRVEPLEADCFATTDRGKVRQILVNLVANGIKFTEEGGVSLRAEFDETRMRISVQDTGIGIAADDLGVIFQEFEQINAAETESKRGTGLGLALSQRLASVLGGSIYVQTMAGEGSTFTLDIPLRYEFAERADCPTPPGPLFEVDANETLPDFAPGEKA